MRVVVCGGRAYKDVEYIWKVLDELHAGQPITGLAHGNAGGIGPISGKLYGADKIAGAWAESHDIPVKPYPVTNEDWQGYGRGAGPRRNRWMLDEFAPDYVVAFPGGRGTADCVMAAKERNIPVLTAPAPPTA